MAERAVGAQSFDFEIAPAMKMYLQGMESWQAACDTLVNHAGGRSASVTAGAALHFQPVEDAVAECQKIGQAAVCCIMQQQMELARFFGQRMASYMEFPHQLVCCHSVGDVGEIEFDFMRRTAVDYVQEAVRLMQPVRDMVVVLSPQEAGQGPGEVASQ